MDGGAAVAQAFARAGPGFWQTPRRPRNRRTFIKSAVLASVAASVHAADKRAPRILLRSSWQFYNTARCWPTRGALLTGYYAQQIHRDSLPELRGGAGGRAPALARTKAPRRVAPRRI